MIVLYFIVLLGGLGVSLVYPILAPMVLESDGFSFMYFQSVNKETAFGILLVSYPLGIIIGSPIIGKLSDKYGKRILLMTSIGLSIFGYIFSAITIMMNNFELFFLSRILLGMFEGKISLARAMAAEFAEKNDVMVPLSKVNAASYTGLMCGPIVGGLLYPFGAEVIFLSVSVVYSISLVIVYMKLNLPERTNINQNDVKTSTSQKSEYINLMGVHLLTGMAIGTAYHFLPAWMTLTLNFSPSDIAEINAVMTIIMIFTSAVLIQRLVSIFSSLQLYISASICLICIYSIMALFNDKISLFLFLFSGSFISIMSSSYSSFVIGRLGKQNSGLLFGRLTSLSSFATIIAAIIASQLLALGANMPIAMAAFLIFVVLIYFVFKYRTVIPHPIQELK
ncbi:MULTISPECIES: MFS transporter [Vibrio]|uniref:MFS transporter n=1 Tax=Vibrio TaxID=662 RepID=UPI00352FB480